MIDNRLGENIKKLRKLEQLSQIGLAQRSKVAIGKIKSLEKGVDPPGGLSWFEAESIARVLGINVIDLACERIK